MATIFPIPDNMTSLIELLPLADTFTAGYLGLLIWIVISVAVFIITSSFSGRDSILATGFISFIVAIFLWILEVLSFNTVLVSVVLLVLALVFGSIKSKGA